jgi:zinc protease
VVVGDVRAKAITDALEARLGRWTPSPAPKSPDLSAKPSSAAKEMVFLIDKPGAVQSVVAIGGIGPALKSPDRYIVRFARAELGRRISSLREEKGYTYGLTTSASLRNGPGTFTVTGSVQTAATKEALDEVFKAMTELTSSPGVTQEGTTQIQDAMVAQWFARFETIDDIASEVSFLVAHDLPDDDYALETARYGAVTKADVDRVAKKYLKPELMTILIVGDRSKIEGPLKSLPFVKSIQMLDTEGKPITAPLVENQISTSKYMRPEP